MGEEVGDMFVEVGGCFGAKIAVCEIALDGLFEKDFFGRDNVEFVG